MGDKEGGGGEVRLGREATEERKEHERKKKRRTHTQTHITRKGKSLQGKTVCVKINM